jgi:hypothetical protein
MREKMRICCVLSSSGVLLVYLLGFAALSWRHDHFLAIFVHFYVCVVLCAIESGVLYAWVRYILTILMVVVS